MTHVFFSHLHFDHCADFIRLFHHRWDASGDATPPMRIYGPKGTQKFVDRVFGPGGAGGLAGPKFVAQLAKDAGVTTLVTSHHGPWIDSDGTRERVIADIGAIFAGRIVWGEDLMSFAL